MTVPSRESFVNVPTSYYITFIDIFAPASTKILISLNFFGLNWFFNSN